MSYTSCDQVLRSYVPLTTMIGTGTTDIQTGDIASLWIAGAEALINGYIASKWVVPVTMPEPLITRLCNDITVYDILKDKQPRIPEFMQRRYDNAIAILEKLRDGDMVLTGSNVVVSSGGDNFAWSNVLSNPQTGPVFAPAQVFSREVNSCWWPS